MFLNKLNIKKLDKIFLKNYFKTSIWMVLELMISLIACMTEKESSSTVILCRLLTLAKITASRKDQRINNT